VLPDEVVATRMPAPLNWLIVTPRMTFPEACSTRPSDAPVMPLPRIVTSGEPA